MKKTMIILLSLLLMLVVGQAAFAKGSVGLTVSYNKAQGNEKYYFWDEYYQIYKFSENGFIFSLTGNYYLTDDFSLAGGISLEKVSGNKYYQELDGSVLYEYGSYCYNYVRLNINLFGKYDLFKDDITNVGMQLGLMDSANFNHVQNDIPEQVSLNSYSNCGTKVSPYFMGSFVTLGAYANVDVTPKLNIYTDIKIPIGFWCIGNSHYWEGETLSFFEVFLYDITLGISSEISPNINLGIEGNISTVNDNGVGAALNKKNNKENGNDKNEIKYFNFSIGAKVGYTF